MKKTAVCLLLVLSVFLMVFCSCNDDNNKLIEGRYSKIEAEYTDSIKNKIIGETKTIVEYINSLDCIETEDGETYYGSDIVLVFYDEKGKEKGEVVVAADQLTIFGTAYTVPQESIEELLELCESAQ